MPKSINMKNTNSIFKSIFLVALMVTMSLGLSAQESGKKLYPGVQAALKDGVGVDIQQKQNQFQQERNAIFNNKITQNSHQEPWEGYKGLDDASAKRQWAKDNYPELYLRKYQPEEYRKQQLDEGKRFLSTPEGQRKIADQEEFAKTAIAKNNRGYSEQVSAERVRELEEATGLKMSSGTPSSFRSPRNDNFEQPYYLYYGIQDLDEAKIAWAADHPEFFKSESPNLFQRGGNETCATAILIECDEGSVVGSTVGASVDDPGFCGTGAGTAGSVWYTWIGNGESITITTCNASITNYDTKLSVYEGDCGALVCVDGNDDGSPLGINPDPDCVIPATGSTFNRASTVTFSSTLGTTYFFMVHGFLDNEGDFELSISNNDCGGGGGGGGSCVDPGVDQLDNSGGLGGIASQIDLVYPFDAEVADDFVVPAGETWNINSVDVLGSYFGPGGGGCEDAVRVNIYNNGAPGPGALFHTEDVPMGSVSGSPNYSITLSAPLNISEGTYWIGVQPIMEFGICGQWGFETRGTVTGSEAYAGFPLLGTPYWTSMTVFQGSPADAAFRINADCATGSCTDEVFVTLTTDDFATETSWVLEDADGVIASLAPGGQASNTTVVYGPYNFDVGNGGSFTIFDSFGDGICCGFGSGDYFVTVNGTDLFSPTGGAFGDEETLDLEPLTDCNDGVFCSSPDPNILDNTLAPIVDTQLIEGQCEVIFDLDQFFVSLDIQHTFTDDLEITISNTCGTITLIFDDGGPDELDGVYIFNTAAAEMISESGAFGGGVIPPGSYIPVDFTAALNCPMSQDWTITIVDDAGGDVGVINEWCMWYEGPCITEPPCEVDVPFDQLLGLEGTGRASQVFPDFGGSVIESADDFNVPLGEIWQISEVEAEGDFFNGFGGCQTGIRLNFYDDDGGQPGALVETRDVTAAGGPDFTALIADKVVLVSGSYWMSYMPIMSFGGCGQWGWETTPTNVMEPMFLRDPDNLLGAGWTDWTEGSVIFGGVNADLSFRITTEDCCEAEAGSFVDVGPLVACAGDPELDLDLQLQQDIIFPGTIIGTGTPGPLAIPDNNPGNPLTDAIVFVGTGEVVDNLNDLYLNLDIDHTWAGDLIIELLSPCGTGTVINRPGVLANPPFGNADDLAGNYSFNVGAALAFPTAAGGSGTIAPDFYQPEDFDPLLNPVSMNCTLDGAWTIRISDNAGGDVGVLNDWSIVLAGPIPNPILYDYVFVIIDEGGTIVGLGDDLSDPTEYPGDLDGTTYNVCGVSIAWDDDINDYVGGPYQALVNDLLSFQICADTTLPCFEVTIYSIPDAGEDAVVDVCELDDPFDLFPLLGGDPDEPGVWTGPSGDPFDPPTYIPGTSTPGVYTYTVDNIADNLCPNVTVSILTDNFPGETTWEITDGGAVLASGGPYALAATLYVEDLGITGDDVDFTIFDSFGDGICCGFGFGEYSVSVNGVVIGSGGAFGASETTNLGAIDCVGCGADEATVTVNEFEENVADAGPDQFLDCGITTTQLAAVCAGGGGCTNESITTLFAANNGGNDGGAVYFDVTINATDISISSLETNTFETGAMTMDVYTRTGTHVGNEGSMAGWTLVATGSGTGAGLNNPSMLTLDNPINLSAGSTNGFALVMDASHGHDYTNGTGSNESFSNADLTIDLGAATNVPFTGGVFSPRVWNGSILYEVCSGGGGGGGGTVIWDEGPDGDLSNFRVAPTTVSLLPTSGLVIGSVGAVGVAEGTESTDALTFTVPAGGSVTTIVLNSFVLAGGNTSTGFNVYTGIPPGAAAFGDIVSIAMTPGDIGSDLLGGAGPLGPGDYSIVLLEGSAPGQLYEYEIFTSGLRPAPINNGVDYSKVVNSEYQDYSGETSDAEAYLRYLDDNKPELATIIRERNASQSKEQPQVNIGALNNRGGCPNEGITTTFIEDNNAMGNMFDITVANEITIENLELNLDAGVWDIVIYFKSGTWVGSEFTSGDWTLVDAQTVTGLGGGGAFGGGTPSPLTSPISLNLTPGDYALYIAVDGVPGGPFNYTNGTAVGNVWATDANLTLYEGAGLNGTPFTPALFSPRNWNGTICYSGGGGGGGGTCDGIWTVLTGGGTVVDPTDPGSTVTGLSTGLNQFIWTVDNGVCPADMDTVDIIQHCPCDAPEPIIAGECVNVVVRILTDDFGGETTWDITDGTGTLASGGPYPSNTLIEEELGLNSADADFTIFDSFGDGICCGFGIGFYEVEVEGIVVASGGSFGSSETTNLGALACSSFVLEGIVACAGDPSLDLGLDIFVRQDITVCGEPDPNVISSTLAPVTNTISVADAGTVVSDLSDLTFTLDIDHTWAGDLLITVEAPNGSVGTILDSEGGNTDLEGIYNFNVDNTTAVGGGGVLPPGDYAPNDLSALMGAPFDGDWTITVEDQVGGDDGELREWCITHPAVQVPGITGFGTPGPLAIPDNDPGNPLTDAIVFNGTGEVVSNLSDFTVSLNIEHTWVGDLKIELLSPCGTGIIMDRPGVPASLFGNSDDLNGVYSFNVDHALPFPENAASGTVAPDKYQPDDFAPLLNPVTLNCTLDGAWTLRVIDNAGGDVGVLNNWSINYNPQDVFACDFIQVELNTGNIFGIGDDLTGIAGNVFGRPFCVYAICYEVASLGDINDLVGTPFIDLVTAIDNGNICANLSECYPVDIYRAPVAGGDAEIDVCVTDDPFNMTTTLVQPNDGWGNWFDPNGDPHSNIFDPAVDLEGIWTYIVDPQDPLNPCPSDTAYLTINVFEEPTQANAGPDQDLCEQFETNLEATPIVPFFGGGNLVITGGPYAVPNATIDETYTVTGETTWTIFDSFGDGICCGFGIGSYQISVNGSVVATGGVFGAQEVVNLGTLSGDDVNILIVLDDFPGETTWELAAVSPSLVPNGDFEDGPGVAWTQTSTNFSSIICDIIDCGIGGGTGPFGGTYWAFFGGINSFEDGSIEQDITIPFGVDADMTFQLEIPVADGADDFLEVLIDGTQVFFVDGSSTISGYALQTVDITPWADGATHNIEFHSTIFSNNGGVTNFMVDDINIFGETGQYGTGMWTEITPGCTSVIDDPFDPNTLVTELCYGDNIFVWCVSHGPCEVSCDTVIVTVWEDPTVADAGPDQQLCDDEFTFLEGNTPTVGNGIWTVMPNPGCFVATPHVLNAPIPDGLGADLPGPPLVDGIAVGGTGNTITNVDQIQFTLDIDHTWAGDLIITVESSCGSTTLMNRNHDGDGADLAGTYHFNASAASDIENAPVNGGEIVPGFYRPDGGFGDLVGCSLDDDWVITITDNFNADIGTLNSWSVDYCTGPVYPDIVDPTNPNTGVDNIPVGCWIFTWTITNGPVCAPSSDDVTVCRELNPNPAPNAGPDQEICNVNAIAELHGNIPDVGDGEWSVLVGGGDCEFDDIESYALGDITDNGNWSTWSGNPGSEGGVVSDAQASSGTQSVLFNAGGQDALYLMGNQSSGRWNITFDMYIDGSGAGAYYNMQEDETAGIGWMYDMVFDNAGASTLDIGGSTIANFTNQLIVGLK